MLCDVVNVNLINTSQSVKIRKHSIGKWENVSFPDELRVEERHDRRISSCIHCMFLWLFFCIQVEMHTFTG